MATFSLRSDPREASRRAGLVKLAIEQARNDFSDRRGEASFEPVVALICAYNEAENLGDVLRAVPRQAGGLGVTTLVVVDGGDDGTDKVALGAGVPTLVFPVNLGHGVACRAGYALALERGAQYVVTLDADGQNDPAELPDILAPLLEDKADFVVGSRVLGLDQTSDQVRRAGVRVFSLIVNTLTGAHLTDTSSGYRSLRATLLSDVLPRLEQEQYQTAELLITALRRGWRVGECPTLWRPRASGVSKKGTNTFFALRYAYVVAATAWRERSTSRSRSLPGAS